MTPAVPCLARRWILRAGATALAVALWSAPAFAQKLGQGADDGISLWRVFAVLVLCLALAAFAAFTMKARMGGGLPQFFTRVRGDRRLQLVETLRLSHQIDLCVVACDGRELLVAASAQGVQLLQELPKAGTPESPAP